MSKDITRQRYILKLNSAKIISNKYDLSISLDQARSSQELIAISESEIIRYIDYLNKKDNVTGRIYNLKMEIKRLKKMKNIKESRPKIRKCYSELDSLMFKPDYITVVIDKSKDYYKLQEHRFSINGIRFRRLLGTPGGVKNNTIVFVNEKLWPALNDFINNGRDLSKAFIPAKLEAYKALVCSSSTPVTSPSGVLVVADAVTHFKDHIIKLDDSNSSEPEMTEIFDYEVTLDNSDGYGMAMPHLMEQWGRDIGVDYLLPGCVIRNSFCKGAICPVDFQKFCLDRGITHVKDVWGNEHDITKIELVLTESMLKLWDSYSSIGDYLENCEKYHYHFSITKNAEKELENMRTTNYQFIQSYNFSDDDIDELIKDTVDEIQDIMKNDWRKTVLYCKGVGIDEKSARNLDGTFPSALMIDERVMNDPFVKSQVSSMIKKRIDRAKIGVLNIPGNYSLVFGDPYALCQSMCGLEITGLLKTHQIYSKHWLDKSVNKVAVFRAPMTSHNNIRILDVVGTEEMREFYQYITTPIIFNAWDMCASAMNGMDYDGDAVISSSSRILIERAIELPAIECIQRKAKKIVPTDEDLMESNIKSFGNAVGAVTNRVTSMFDVQAGFEKGSKEYNILDYRIKCGQLYQQNSIDKTKGIDAKPMPSEWYIFAANKINDDDSEELVAKKELYKTLIAEKKPYFMQYIYPEEKKQYDEYMKQNSEKCKMRFGMTIDKLEQLEQKTEEQEAFIRIYKKNIPLGMNPCVINRICWKIENIFEKPKNSTSDFDYTIYLNQSGDFNQRLYNQIYSVYLDYQNELKKYMIENKKKRISSDEKAEKKYTLMEDFRRRCEIICPDESMLCNIIILICYRGSNTSKQFAWDVCGEQIINHLLTNGDGSVRFPTKDPDGDIEFHGERFSIHTIKVGDFNGDNERDELRQGDD